MEMGINWSPICLTVDIPDSRIIIGVHDCASELAQLSGKLRLLQLQQTFVFIMRSGRLGLSGAASAVEGNS